MVTIYDDETYNFRSTSIHRDRRRQWTFHGFRPRPSRFCRVGCSFPTLRRIVNRPVHFEFPTPFFLGGGHTYTFINVVHPQPRENAYHDGGFSIILKRRIKHGGRYLRCVFFFMVQSVIDRAHTHTSAPPTRRIHSHAGSHARTLPRRNSFSAFRPNTRLRAKRSTPNKA